jgi:hypothetical protein
VNATLNILTLVVAGSALLVAALDYRRQSEIGRQQTALQERVTAIEEERRAEERRSLATADVTARCIPKNEPFNLRIFVFLRNKGSGVAHDVTIIFSEQSNALRPGRLKNPNALPIPVLNGGEERGIELDSIPAGTSDVGVVLAWRDEEGPKTRPTRLSWVEWAPGPNGKG